MVKKTAFVMALIMAFAQPVAIFAEDYVNYETENEYTYEDIYEELDDGELDYVNNTSAEQLAYDDAQDDTTDYVNISSVSDNEIDPDIPSDDSDDTNDNISDNDNEINVSDDVDENTDAEESTEIIEPLGPSPVQETILGSEPLAKEHPYFEFDKTGTVLTGLKDAALSRDDMTIPKYVKKIGPNAFERLAYNDRGVRIIYIEDGSVLEEIGNEAFANLTNLQMFPFNEGLKKIGASAFQNCQKLGFVTLPSSLQTIGADAFKECYGINTLTIKCSDSIKIVNERGQIGDNLGIFQGTRGIVDVKFENISWTKIPAGFFKGAFSENYIFVLPDTVQVIEKNAFRECNARGVFANIGSMLTTIGNDAFADATKLMVIPMPSGLKTIGDRAFQNVSNSNAAWMEKISEIKIPSTVTQIGAAAFDGMCSGQTVHVYIPSSVTRIGNKTFSESTCRNFYFHLIRDSVAYTKIKTEFADVLPDDHFIVSCGIRYYLNNGLNNPDNEYTFLTGDEVTIYNPSRPGYTFTGWFYDEKFKKPLADDPAADPLKIKPNDNISIYAKWEANTYNIEYAIEHGEHNFRNPYTLKSNSNAFALNAPTVDAGYMFAGWYDSLENATLAGKIGKITKLVNITCDTTIYAAILPIKYTVNFNTNGGDKYSPVPTAIVAEYDKADTIPTVIPTRTGYDFIGWTIKRNSGIPYVIGDEFINLANKNNAKITLNALWQERSYNINCVYDPHHEFKDSTDTGKNANPTTRLFTKKINLAGETHNGYKFLGWYSNPDYLGDAVKSISAKTTEDVTVYAKWQQLGRNYSFDLNYPRGEAVTGLSIDDIMLTGDRMKYAPDLNNEAARSYLTTDSRNYVFTGWNTKKDGKGTFLEDGGKLNLITGSGNVKLYAQWKVYGPKINYVNLIDKPYTNNNPEYASMIRDTKLSAAKMEGYIFKGWSDSAVGGSQIVGISKTDAASMFGRGAEINLYTRWEPISYTVKFNANRGTGTMPVINAAYDNTYYLPSNGFVRYGYEFTNWNTAANGKGISYVSGNSINNLLNKKGTVNMYAQWKVIEVPIQCIGTRINDVDSVVSGLPSWNSKGESVVVPYSKMLPAYATVEKDVKLKNPYVRGYIFDGWYEDAAYTKKISNIKKAELLDKFKKGAVTEPIKVYAKWRKVR